MENSNPYGNKFLPYLREDRLPHIFCPGCGNGTIMNAFIKGINEIINAGRVLGTAIRRLFDNSMCELK